MKSPIKSYTDFVKETDTVGHDEVNATKPTALSEKLCEMIENCMSMAKAEAHDWHNDDDKDHTAESYMSECDSYIKECMEGLKLECGDIMKGGDYNDSDGNMRQGSVQDVPAMSGAVR